MGFDTYQQDDNLMVQNESSFIFGTFWYFRFWSCFCSSHKTDPSKYAFCPWWIFRVQSFQMSRSLLAMRAFAAVMATTELTTPSFLLTIWRKLQTSSSTVSNIRGLPRFKVPISLSTFGPFSLDPGISCVVLLLGFLQVSNEDENF